MSSLSWSSSEAESETRFLEQEANLRGDFQEAKEAGEERKGRRKSQERWSLWAIGFHLCQDPEAQRLGYPLFLTVEGCPQGCYLMLPGSEGEKQRGT